jgi:hypothetical protein
VPPEVESSLGVYQVHTNQSLYVHTPDGSIPGLKTYHVEDSNQNFYSVPIATDASTDEIWKRLATINELVMANPNSRGIKALLGARDRRVPSQSETLPGPPTQGKRDVSIAPPARESTDTSGDWS